MPSNIIHSPGNSRQFMIMFGFIYAHKYVSMNTNLKFNEINAPIVVGRIAYSPTMRYHMHAFTANEMTSVSFSWNTFTFDRSACCHSSSTIINFFTRFFAFTFPPNGLVDFANFIDINNWTSSTFYIEKMSLLNKYECATNISCIVISMNPKATYQSCISKHIL